jgi:hypothetical protein
VAATREKETMSTPSTAAPRTIETLKAAIAGRVFVPGEAGYDQGRQAWNLAVDHAVIHVPGHPARFRRRRPVRNLIRVTLSAPFVRQSWRARHDLA